ncbi:MAG: hypothetical protein Q9192_007449 [Flavoplaca navasiana]
MMMAINIRNPSHELKINSPSISDDDLAGRLPRVHRFSDVAWKVWSGLHNNDPGSLRYIGHDYVSNPTTEALMNKTFGTAFRCDKEVPWPGLPFGLDSDQGKALLAAPNGLGTARILIDRVATLGRRKVTFKVFTGANSDGYYYCMLWDLGPP